MLSPPEGLSEDVLVSALARGWGVTVSSMTYRPVGFGSHHWEVVDADGLRRFVTVDDLETKRHSRREPLDGAFHRLRASLGAARDLADHGHPYVVAPVPTREGEPVARAGERFGVTLYPFVAGRSFAWGDFSAPGHRRALLDLVIAVHTAPPAARRRAPVDDFVIPHRDELESALHGADAVADHGPYARPAALLLAEHAGPLRGLLGRYDDLVREARAQPARAVLTHGEPHPGNSMLTADGWLLIDWETALVAPPERDLWNLDPGDGSLLGAYAEATGSAPLPSMLELYRIRWDLADVAIEVHRFRRPHTGDHDDEQGWQVLRSVVTGISREAERLAR